VLSADDAGARVALVATGALLLGGDHVMIDVHVGAGARLEVVETAGTVAFDAGGTESSWSVRVTLGPGARVVWESLPFVVADGADVTRTTDVTLGEGARALLRETLVLGRTGERGGPVRTRTRATAAGAALLAEALDLLPAARTMPGIIGQARVLDTVLALGWRPGGGAAAHGPGQGARQEAPHRPGQGAVHRLELEGPGAIARRLDAAAHTSARLDSVWRSWRAELSSRPAIAPRPATGRQKNAMPV
jgi:urease accessory protein